MQHQPDNDYTVSDWVLLGQASNHFTYICMQYEQACMTDEAIGVDVHVESRVVYNYFE